MNENKSKGQEPRAIAATPDGAALAAGTGRMDEGSVLAAYSRWAPFYDLVFGASTFWGRRAIARVINALAPGRVLEAGVGTGLALPTYDRRHLVHGIDLSPDMLQRARRRAARRRLANVEALQEMDAGHLAMADATFDAVVASYLMTVVPEPGRVMSEFARVTRPGGLIVVISHFASENWYRVVERWLSRFSARIGWQPDVPVDRFLSYPHLRLVEKRTVAPFGLFTLLVFERV